MDKWMNGQMNDGQKVITIAHPEHSSGELKIKNTHMCILNTQKINLNSEEYI